MTLAEERFGLRQHPLVDAEVNSLVDAMRSRLGDTATGSRDGRRRFENQLRGIWHDPLDRLLLLLDQAQDAGAWFVHRRQELTERSPDHRLAALSRLLARGCRAFAEVHVLLCSGFPDEAMAGCRTLFELDAVSRVLAANGEELSERYLAHAEFVALTVLSRESSREPVEPDLAGLDSGHIAAELEAIRTLYGPVMKHDWGWIAELAWPLHPEQKRFEKFRPSFFDVVKLAGMKERYDSDYGLTSDFSHASSLGTLFSMGQTPAGRGSADIPLVGMSGLDQAGGGASQSFAFIATSLLMSAFEEEAGTASGEQEAKAVFEAPIRAFALQELAKDAAMAFTQVAENLRRHPELLEDA